MTYIAPLTRYQIYAPGDALSEQDRETIAHLLRSGFGENSARALRSDLDYLEAWSFATTGDALAWPPERSTVLSFVAHHLWDPSKREEDPAHGMPGDVEAALRASGHLRADGPHAPSTVRRRMASWKSVASWREVETAVFSDPVVRRTLSAAVRASDRPRRKKSQKPVTLDLLRRLLVHLDKQCQERLGGGRVLDRGSLAALRDRAVLALAFASGGRRRSEMADLMLSQLEPQEPLQDEETGEDIPSLAIRMGRTKTTDAKDDQRVFVSGAAVTCLEAWIEAADVTSGYVFRRIDRWGNISEHGVSGSAVNEILKARLREIGEDPASYSAHGVRSGFVTEALNQGLRLEEIMGQTLHRSSRTVHGYFQDVTKRTGRAARLLR